MTNSPVIVHCFAITTTLHIMISKLKIPGRCLGAVTVQVWIKCMLIDDHDTLHSILKQNIAH